MATNKLDQDTARKRLLSLPPDRYGKRFKCHAPAMLELALDRLSRIPALA